MSRPNKKSNNWEDLKSKGKGRAANRFRANVAISVNRKSIMIKIDKSKVKSYEQSK